MMETEKKRSKGGFLHLFDWNGKSRKKLFSSHPELDGKAKNGKENVGTMAKSLLQVIEVDESRASSSNRGSSDLNCASSVTSDEGDGTRPPGVVARLMGLDSLPTSNVSEPFYTPFSNLGSLRMSRYDRGNPNFCSENHPVDYLNMPSKEWFSRNPVESRVQKQNRPIERFRTEMLPPKSAKSIPITHYKLLSPIKIPGIVPARNTAYIVEAAAKIIEASPQATTKSKTSIASSVPLRIRDLKEKMEATHTVPKKSSKSLTVAYTKSHGESDGTPAVKASVNQEKRIPENLKKGKPVSMAVQAKVNVQRRDGSAASSSNNSSMHQKEKSGVKANQLYKSQPETQRTAQKGTSTNSTNNVLRQNNQKQNYMFNKDNLNLRTPVLDQQVRKSKSTSCAGGPCRTVNKVVANPGTRCRKTGLTTNDTGKDSSSTKAKNLSQKKQFASGNSPSEGCIADNELKKEEKSIKCNNAVEWCMNWGADNRKNGMDVVSFTFSSPIRSRPDPESSVQIMAKHKTSNIDSIGDNNQLYFKNSTVSSPGLNIIGGDALSILLEQKLRELTSKVESTHCNVIRERPSSIAAPGVQDSLPTLGVVMAEEEKRLHNNNSDSLGNSCTTDNDSLARNINPDCQFQHCEEMDRQSISSNNDENGREFDCLQFSMVPSLEHSDTSVICSDNRNSTNDSKHVLLAEDQAESTSISTNLSVLLDCEIELSDSASSIWVGKTSKKHLTRTFSLVDVNESSNWEFDYLRELLDNAELTMNEFALGLTHQVMTPSLLNQLETWENKMGRNIEGYSKLGRRVLFDYVCECLDSKCHQLFFASCKGWAKWVTLFQRKGWMAEMLYKEIVYWKSMGELMVDELVDKDMSSQCGNWLDFYIEAFEEGVEIESRILTSLLDELVSDFLLF